MSTVTQNLDQIKNHPGFIAALDQSGGSTPKALRKYGIPEDSYTSDAAMFDLVHQMRNRIITSPAFTGKEIFGTILFEDTVDRQIAGIPTAQYLWEKKNIVPIIKVDQGLASEKEGVRLMKPMSRLNQLLEKGKSKGIFATKMRSMIKLANPQGIAANIRQQFEYAKHILQAGLYPIVEPEIDINSPEKEAAEAIVKQEILQQANQLLAGEKVMLKLTLPEKRDFYRDLQQHPQILRVLALSGGYSQQEANRRLQANPSVTASFSRALTEGLQVDQSDTEFNQTLKESIEAIFTACQGTVKIS